MRERKGIIKLNILENREKKCEKNQRKSNVALKAVNNQFNLRMGTHESWVDPHPVGGGRGSRRSLPIFPLVLPLCEQNDRMPARGVTLHTIREWEFCRSPRRLPS